MPSTLRDLTFIEDDFLTADLPTAGYDFICSVSAIHHMDFEAALGRMRQMLRPGGTLVVIGLARETTPAEWAVTIAAAPVVRITKVLRRAHGPEGMPVTDPQMSYGQVRAAARRLLPGVRHRRHVLRRYSLTWENPAASALTAKVRQVLPRCVRSLAGRISVGERTLLI
ncbi:class I SAM-dependent methyltransferase [Streptosporangium sandarakinum]|uniref:class I SAM-dependent methyltransferase n=1 Tax=Streptosporangium sandarakinum TaxID=1260955 RepID=UPI003713D546